MGEELVTQTSSETNSVKEPPPRKTHTELFYECLPEYLAIGMTSEEYWHGDSALTIAYRKAWRIKHRTKNQDAWWQGRYIYDAILTALAGKDVHYLKEPYPVTKEEIEAIEERRYNELKQALKKEARKNNGI